ncbi:MAG: hypothetical protein OEZ36_09820 [Spirochaetota bacterium]|nr:hypothetical protein [Spirochaetota bacterium]
MTEQRKKLIKLVILISIPIIIGINYLIIYFIPTEWADSKKVYWFSMISAPSSIMVSILVLFGIYRYYSKRGE